MIPARTDPHHQNVVHFKKRWLSQERALSAETSDRAAMIRSYVSLAKEEAECPPLASPSTATRDPSPFQSAADQFPAASLRRHSSGTDGISLSIPRFAKYGAHVPLLAQCSSASSALCSADSPSPAAAPAPSPAADHPHSWLLRAASSDAETCKLQLGSKRLPAYQPSVSTERFMIDINKPPPSPEGHCTDSEMNPSTPHSAPSADLPGLPRAYGMGVMDYSFSDLNAASPSWLASSSGSVDHRRAAAPSTRKGPHAQSALLHLPTLRGGLPAGTARRGPSEPARRQSGLSLSFSEHDVSPPPPLAQQQKQGLPARPAAAHQGHAVGRRSSPAAASETPSPQPQHSKKPRSQWSGSVATLLAHSRHAKAESEEQVEEEDEDEENEQEGEEEGEEGDVKHGSGGEEDECASRGGSPKACLHCNTTKTPLWRNGPPGPKSLCNACGIRFNKIRSGKRKPTPKEAAMLLKYERSGSTMTGTSDVSAASSPERGSSKVAGLKGEKRQGQGKVGAEAEAERKLLQSLPVAGAHKSRSKMQRQNSAGPRAGPTAVKVSLFGGRKRSPESEEGYTEGEEERAEDDQEGRPLRLAFQHTHRSKRACLSGYGYATAAGRDADSSSSSDQESCLSDHAHSPPESPRVLKAHRGLVLSRAAMYEPSVPLTLPSAGFGDEDEAYLKVSGAKGDLGGSDVEIGARLLMEIFHSSPLVMC